MLGSLILYLKGMRILMFQLSGFWYKEPSVPTTRSPLQGAGRRSYDSSRRRGSSGLCSLVFPSFLLKGSIMATIFKASFLLKGSIRATIFKASFL